MNVDNMNNLEDEELMIIRFALSIVENIVRSTDEVVCDGRLIDANSLYFLKEKLCKTFNLESGVFDS